MFFNGQQNNYYTEASLLARQAAQHYWWRKHYRRRLFAFGRNTCPMGNFSNLVMGIFAQDTWQLLASTKIEGGLRLDHHTTYGNFVLPRIALFQRINKEWGARARFWNGLQNSQPLDTPNSGL